MRNINKQKLVKVGSKIVGAIDWASLNMVATFYAIKYIWIDEDSTPRTLDMKNISKGGTR